jgi:hypothetical protein
MRAVGRLWYGSASDAVRYQVLTNAQGARTFVSQNMSKMLAEDRPREAAAPSLVPDAE